MADFKKMDKRVLVRNIQKGLITESEYSQYLSDLEDNQSDAEVINLDEESDGMPTVDEYADDKETEETDIQKDE